MRVTCHIAINEDFVQGAASFLSHVAQCPECQGIALEPDGLRYIEYLFDNLNGLSDRKLRLHDYKGAVDLCRYMLMANGLVMQADLPEHGNTDTRH